MTPDKRIAGSPGLWEMRGLKLLAAVAAMGILAGIFVSYLRPEFLQTLADHLWACF